MNRYDIAIVGGGIHGVAVAQAAAAAGYKTLLIEQGARLALGTSSRSSKLIHGGLRYLESMQLNLVRECLSEQRLLLHLAPELVRLVPFHIPIYGDTSRPGWMIRAGLTLYRLLGSEPFAAIPRRDWQELDGLRLDGLRHLFRYFDAQTDDAALTRAIMASALQLGAGLRLATCVHSGERVTDGYRLQLVANGAEQEVAASMLVNAAGPWVNSLLQRLTPRPPLLPVDLVAGSHLIVPGSCRHGIYYLEAPQDRRAVFVMPWQGQKLIGTTETAFSGDPAQIAPTDAEIDYLLAVHNHYFTPKVERTMVVGSFAGLRVLPKGEGSHFLRPRETIFLPDDAAAPRLLTIYGGKLTAARATADKLLHLLAPHLPARNRLADTAQLPLTPVAAGDL